MKKMPHSLLTAVSIVIGIVLWYILSAIPAIGAIITNPTIVVKTFISETASGRMWTNVGASLFRVLGGFSLGLIVAIPVAFLMGWYSVVRSVVEPWIQFFRTIPPIALIPLVIVAQGVGESAKVTVIFVSTFLVMVISIFQGVRNVDPTLIRASRVLGARDRDIFFEVIVPASFPYILVGVRLGLAAAWTTLVAAELTGANKGLGNMIMEASLYFRMEVVILGIIVIGIIGLAMDKFVLFLERRLTGWQEVRNA
ncbi:ABC transporter permease [Paenibacillus doosanensis]|uniref:Aliphatic sulfonates transport permease protein SsuC n=1 Tax=Paenibacillus konkukensis TaxID=2020716 RepID=A0ABY4RM49_9BACL|nr:MULTISPECIES: ABC transporter permease [Paenibacillus]MCS7461702.1 ABC transporter permease [Paenibacillus doosanensis]UQZ83544.1 Putative aliphatic sulfonates transport permease protein SsuC [Paenibacillus konkukensis]